MRGMYFSRALLAGIARDGGLYVPAAYPSPLATPAWRFMAYREMAFRMLRGFVRRDHSRTLRRVCRRVYGRRFCSTDGNGRARDAIGAAWIVGGVYLGGLSWGPSLSFKDLAMQALGAAFEEAVLHYYHIVGATSGDTGGAACRALEGSRKVGLLVLSPAGGVSAFQAEQMYGTIAGTVVHACLRGGFDCCQDVVKALLGMRRRDVGTANSINLARLLLQSVYYLALREQLTAWPGERVCYHIPSGNFGNTFSYHIARLMGTPHVHATAATNENNVLDCFIKAGVCIPRSPAGVKRTHAPSMDISWASNIERLLYEVLGRCGSMTRLAMRARCSDAAWALLRHASYRRLRLCAVSSDASLHVERSMLVELLYRRHGVAVDTHTAAALKSAMLAPRGDVQVALETARDVKLKAELHGTHGHGFRHAVPRRARHARLVHPASAHIRGLLRIPAVQRMRRVCPPWPPIA
ncbi:Threonine synthase [Candidatus Tremblaya princeps]|uniref:Threonine synthase n=1 Tax=Tremblaya princeps TaxID=189385 RepID=A0A143WNJ3_TREPR|nr:Threonine synthase [Candidatus Tremblaya princeps]